MAHQGMDDPDLPLAELMRGWPETVGVFLRHRMLCPGCPIAVFHTVSDACMEYDLDLEAFADELLAASGGRA